MDAEMSSSRDRSPGAQSANERMTELLDVEPAHGVWPGKSRKMVRLAERYGAEAALAQLALPETLDRFLDAAQALEKAPNGALLNGIINGYQRVMMAGDQRIGQPSVGTFSDHVTRLSALRRINQAATASLDLEAMMQTVVGVVRDTMGCQSCSIFLMDEGNAMLVLSASVGLNPQAIGRVYMPLGTGITGTAAQTRQLLAIPDAVAHPAYIDYPLLDDQRYSSQVSVPMALRSPDRLVGVLNILSISRREFDEDELAFLETAAGEIAIAIEILANGFDVRLAGNIALRISRQ